MRDELIRRILLTGVILLAIVLSSCQASYIAQRERGRRYLFPPPPSHSVCPEEKYGQYLLRTSTPFNFGPNKNSVHYPYRNK